MKNEVFNNPLKKSFKESLKLKIVLRLKLIFKKEISIYNSYFINLEFNNTIKCN